MNGARLSRAVVRPPMCGVLALAASTSCSGRVNLGDNSSSPDVATDAPDATLPDDPPATLFELTAQVGRCFDVAVDDTYLYLSASGPGGPSLFRCTKSNCAATMAPIAGPSCPSCSYQQLVVLGDQLGLVRDDSDRPSSLVYVDVCTLPDCADRREVVGNVPWIAAFEFTPDRFYFGIFEDRSLYECALPTCAGGPGIFARGAIPGRLEASVDWVYWLENRSHIKRKRKDRTSAIEHLVAGATLDRTVDGGLGPGADGPRASDIEIDEPWLYAMVVGSGNADRDAISTSPDGCTIARWPSDEVGGAREIVVTTSASKEGGNAESVVPMRVFRGELVFASDQTYRCDADNCMATLRPLGSADPARMASDGDFLYWCTRTAGTLGMVQRVARIRRASAGPPPL